MPKTCQCKEPDPAPMYPNNAPYDDKQNAARAKYCKKCNGVIKEGKTGRPRKAEADRLVMYNVRVTASLKEMLGRVPAVKIRDGLERIARQAFDPSAD